MTPDYQLPGGNDSLITGLICFDELYCHTSPYESIPIGKINSLSPKYFIPKINENNLKIHNPDE